MPVKHYHPLVSSTHPLQPLQLRLLYQNRVPSSPISTLFPRCYTPQTTNVLLDTTLYHSFPKKNYSSFHNSLMYQSKPIHCMQNMEQYILCTYFSLFSPAAPRGTLPSITKDHNSLSIRYIVINTDTVKNSKLNHQTAV